MTRVTLVQEYFHPWPNSAGFYLARERGWFDEAGIDVELRTVDSGRGDSLGHLIDGRGDLAVVPSNRLLVRREAGHAVHAIAAVNQRGLETVRTRSDSGIHRLRDLEGRRIALNPTPRGVAIVRDLVARDGGDPDLVTLVDSGTRELDPADHFGGTADASFGSYWAWDNLLSSAHERVWNVDEALGLEYHSYLLAARDDIDPALVEDVIAISARGFAEAAESPDAVAAIYETVIPYFAPSVIRRSAELIATTWLHAGQWGVIRPQLVAPYARWLHGHGILRDPEIWREAVRSQPVAQDWVS